MNTTKLRGPTLGLTLAAACVAALPVHAQDRTGAHAPASKQENIGVFSGMVIGAAAAGPFGAIAGAAAGAFLGDKYHKKAVENATLSNDLSKSEARRQELAKNVSDLNGQLQGQKQVSQFGAVLNQTDDLVTDISFRTNDASINASSLSPLLKLGALAAAMPDVKVRVAGYADPRGSDELNDKLSKDRADAVAAVLAQSGLSPDQVIVEAHGKSQSESCDGDVDGYAFDRRVTVRIERKSAQEVASR
jgi:outer membrane protein OmpA-like peptidoglycan-associated protein